MKEEEGGGKREGRDGVAGKAWVGKGTGGERWWEEGFAHLLHSSL